MNMQSQPASAYFLDDRKQAIETHTLCVVVDNEPGVLARVIGLFSGRGYNIDSLTVSESEHEDLAARRSQGAFGQIAETAHLNLMCVHDPLDLAAAQHLLPLIGLAFP